VSYILTQGKDRLAEIEETVIDAIKSQMDDGGGAILLAGEPIKRFQSGQRVKVVGGAYLGMDGLYVSRAGDRITCLLDMFGRKTRTNLPERFIT